MSNKRLRSGKICCSVVLKTPKAQRIWGGKINRSLRHKSKVKAEGHHKQITDQKLPGAPSVKQVRKYRRTQTKQSELLSPVHLNKKIRLCTDSESVSSWRSTSVNPYDTDSSGDELSVGVLPLHLDSDDSWLDPNEGNLLEWDNLQNFHDLPIPDLPVIPVDEARQFINRIPLAPPVPPVRGHLPVVIPRRQINMAEFTAMKPNTFYGFARENANEFIRQFLLYLNVHGVNTVEANPYAEAVATGPAMTRFQLCISGDCARWYQSLPADYRWPDIERAFRAKYCDLANNWTENVCLRSIVQKPDESVEI